MIKLLTYLIKALFSSVNSRADKILHIIFTKYEQLVRFRGKCPLKLIYFVWCSIYPSLIYDSKYSEGLTIKIYCTCDNFNSLTKSNKIMISELDIYKRKKLINEIETIHAP